MCYKNGIIKGVSWDKSKNKWKAYIKIDGKTKNLGYYDDKLSAIYVRYSYELKYNWCSSNYISSAKQYIDRKALIKFIKKYKVFNDFYEEAFFSHGVLKIKYKDLLIPLCYLAYYFHHNKLPEFEIDFIDKNINNFDIDNMILNNVKLPQFFYSVNKKTIIAFYRKQDYRFFDKLKTIPEILLSSNILQFEYLSKPDQLFTIKNKLFTQEQIMFLWKNGYFERANGKILK